MRRVRLILILAVLLSISASHSLRAQDPKPLPFTSPTTLPESQLCWSDDPNDSDNMILGPCRPESQAPPENVADGGLQPEPKLQSQPESQPATPKPTEDNQQSVPSSDGSGPLVASGWCVVQSSKSKPTATSTSTTVHSAPGCDVGLGVSLLRFHFVRLDRLSLVSVLGTKTLGLGLALVVVKPTPAFPRVVALAFGLVVQYDSSGIYRQVYPALGATMSFKERQ